MTEAIIIAVIGSGAFSAIIAGIFNLIINRKGRLKDIETKIDEVEKALERAEKDELRTQLLLLLSDYPQEKAEILTIAKHYFSALDGNWYCSSLFLKWLENSGTAKPQWFQEVIQK